MGCAPLMSSVSCIRLCGASVHEMELRDGSASRSPEAPAIANTRSGEFVGLCFFVLFFGLRDVGGVGYWGTKGVRRLRGAREAWGRRGGGCSRPESLRASGLRSNIQLEATCRIDMT